MEVIKPGRIIPEFFIGECKKYGMIGRCGAVLKVYKEDCFRVDKTSSELSFFCAHCGVMVTPYKELQDWRELRDSHAKTQSEFIQFLQTENNTPPWAAYSFPILDDWSKENNVKVGVG